MTGGVGGRGGVVLLVFLFLGNTVIWGDNDSNEEDTGRGSSGAGARPYTGDAARTLLRTLPLLLHVVLEATSVSECWCLLGCGLLVSLAML